MEIENFLKGELVWHTNFKFKVQFLSELKTLKGRWFYVQLLESGGFMETQLITKYKNQQDESN